jgi:excisionase family DNA binding protein
VSTEALAPEPRSARLRRLVDLLEAAKLAAQVDLERELEAEQAPRESDPMLTVAEAAVELHRSPSHVRTQCRKGAITSMRDGADYRIRRSALAAYERRRTQ